MNADNLIKQATRTLQAGVEHLTDDPPAHDERIRRASDLRADMRNAIDHASSGEHGQLAVINLLMQSIDEVHRFTHQNFNRCRRCNELAAATFECQLEYLNWIAYDQ